MSNTFRFIVFDREGIMGANNREPLRISVKDARGWFEEDDTTYLDVVDPETFEKKDYKVKGAVRIDPREIKEEYDQMPEDDHILAYWTWPNEETSASVAHFLRKQGYDAFAIEGGLEAWQENGYPVEKKVK